MLAIIAKVHQNAAARGYSRVAREKDAVDSKLCRKTILMFQKKIVKNLTSFGIVSARAFFGIWIADRHNFSTMSSRQIKMCWSLKINRQGFVAKWIFRTSLKHFCTFEGS